MTVGWTAAAATLVLSNCFVINVNAADLNGDWFRDDGNTRIRIAPCEGKLCATNMWVKDTSKDEEVGDQLLMSLKRESEEKFIGIAYDSKRKRTYRITITVESDRLITRGCVAFGLLCKGTGWKRVN